VSVIMKSRKQKKIKYLKDEFCCLKSREKVFVVKQARQIVECSISDS